jgi:translation initiation factor 4A
VYGYGFEIPSPIQQRAIAPIIARKDVIAQAQAGSGKTGAFSIGMLQRIATIEDFSSSPSPLALILTPNRELSQQIHKVISSLGRHMGVKALVCCGGRPVRENVEGLRKRDTQVVVGTPGRIFDLISRGFLDCSRIQMVCLDEADKMLDIGFRDLVHDILTSGLPASLQLLLFSATMPGPVVELAKRLMVDPVHVVTEHAHVAPKAIDQYYVFLDDPKWKLEVLCDLYGALSVTQSIIFCNNRRTVDYLVEELTSRHFTVSATHGEMEQRERESVLAGFREGSSRVLITTDLLSRGIDVQQVSMVVNYDFPLRPQAYIHRIGRSGRHSRKGLAISLVTRDDGPAMDEVEARYTVRLKELPADFMDSLA